MSGFTLARFRAWTMGTTSSTALNIMYDRRRVDPNAESE